MLINLNFRLHSENAWLISDIRSKISGRLISLKSENNKYMEELFVQESAMRLKKQRTDRTDVQKSAEGKNTENLKPGHEEQLFSRRSIEASIHTSKATNCCTCMGKPNMLKGSFGTFMKNRPTTCIGAWLVKFTGRDEI